MNESEKIAKEWLIKNGFKNIKFNHSSNPDFIADGIEFEVKTSNKKILCFQETQQGYQGNIIVIDNNKIADIGKLNDLINKGYKWRIQKTDDKTVVIRIDKSVKERLDELKGSATFTQLMEQLIEFFLTKK